MKVRELLSDESKWTKGAMARNEHGTVCDIYFKGAVCWCLRGAIDRCYTKDRLTTVKKVYEKLHLALEDWNDVSERTFEDVKRLVKDLDI